MNLKIFFDNFLGNSPNWYKHSIILFLIMNPIIFSINPYFSGWILVAQFIFTLSMALKCYPLLPGGLLAIEAIAIGMTDPDHLYREMIVNFPVIALLIFMVASIYFMKDLLLLIFSKIFIKIRSKIYLSLSFLSCSAILSAFLDALTVIAVIITITFSFYNIYHEFRSNNDNTKEDFDEHELNEFRGFLRNILMHSGIGSALGGIATMVGEPQNLIIAKTAGWGFLDFVMVMLPISIPTFFAGALVCYILEKYKVKTFDFGYELPENVYKIIKKFNEDKYSNITSKERAQLIIQGICGVILILSLSFHIAEVGLIGLMLIILLTSFNGISDEHQIGESFKESLPFTSLLVVFFTIIAVIVDQQLFKPIIDMAMHYEGKGQQTFFFVANGLLSVISDNVFVGSVYIKEIKSLLDSAIITRDQFDLLAISVNAGTNLPSIATPNGQAAFLFLLTSKIAPLVRLSYMKMVLMALPYTMVITIVSYLCMYYLT
jgi:NhaB family Na+:H+ antiporter